MALGFPVSDLTRTSPRTPWAAPNTPMRIRRPGARKLGSGGGFGGFRGGGAGRGGALLRLLPRLRPGRVVARLALHEAEAVEEAQHAVGGLGALAEPAFRLLLIEGEARGVVVRLQGIVGPDPLDEPAVARHARVGDDDAVEGALFGARAREADFQGHIYSSFPSS